MMNGDDGEDLPMLCFRLVRALGTLLLAVAALVVVLAMFWRDVRLASFLDQWFGGWSDRTLTLAATLMLGLSALAFRLVERSERRYAQKRRSLSRHGFWG
ncbi:hypothetical protein [Ralstonia sp. GX3-BWBA]|uniref:hypothetical protein n=1 Tax=Ralstonia sp. GX3-BWBA TaxID=2219865 RepID=UPI000DD4AFC3|nr:hypothetical protein [Ralstonia sp. GX3-BWBA]